MKNLKERERKKMEGRKERGMEERRKEGKKGPLSQVNVFLMFRRKRKTRIERILHTHSSSDYTGLDAVTASC